MSLSSIRVFLVLSESLSILDHLDGLSKSYVQLDFILEVGFCLPVNVLYKINQPFYPYNPTKQVKIKIEMWLRKESNWFFLNLFQVSFLESLRKNVTPPHFWEVTGKWQEVNIK